MVTIMRVQADWTGFPGAPGYSSFYFRDFGTGGLDGTEPDQAQAQSAADRVSTFFTNVRAHIAAEVNLAINPEVEFIEDTTGLMQSIAQISPTPITGVSAGGSWSGPVGAVVNWRTDSVKKGRRIRGRTFLVPIVSSRYHAQGGLAEQYRASIETAATNLIDTTDTPDLGVYSRPSGPGATDGQWAVVSSCNVPGLSAVLRSRRD